ncbi:MAG: O-antigen ligase family protein [Aeromicrobium sp.]
MSWRGAGLLTRLRPPPVLVAALITGLALAVLIPIAVTSTYGTVGVIFALVVFAGLVVVGFGYTSEFFVILGACLVPMSNLHPVDAVSFITVADASFAVGFGLMLPDLMRRPLQLPTVFVVGVVGVFTVALFSSVLADDPVGSFNYLARLLVGAFGLSILIVWWNPDRVRVLLIACAYVLGNVISVGYALGSGQEARDGRRGGLAEHPNVYGLTCMLAVTIVPFIVTQFPRSWRWIPAGAGVVCLYGVYSSGSRAALAVLIGVAVILPVLARSVPTALALLTALATFLVFSTQLLGTTSSGNALGRLLGAGSADLSDLAREQLLEEAIDRFWDSPIIGNGLAGIIEAHVIYVQIAAALGVIGLAFYLLVLWSTVHPITVLSPPYSLLAVPALSYVVLGFVTPVLWDRYIWMVTSLALLAPGLAAAAAADGDTSEIDQRNEVADASA